MNQAELAVYAAVCLSLAVYVYWRFRSWRDVAILTGLCTFPLYLSLEGTSQFLTADENYYIHQLASSDRRGFLERELQYGAFRTSLSILSPIVRVLRPSAEWPAVSATIILKLSHWVTGWLSFLWIVHLLLEVKPSPAPRLLFFLAFGLLLLPISHMALKTFNYDVLSMNLGIVALLYLVLAWQTNQPRLSWLAVIAGTLAAQEKLIASPVLLVAIVVAAGMIQHQGGARAWLRVPLNALLGIGLSWGLGLMCVTFLRLSVGLSFGNLGVLCRQGAEPLVIWGFAVLRFTVGTNDYAAYFPVLLGMTFAFCLAGACFLGLLAHPTVLERLTRWGRFLPITFGVLLTATLLIGVAGNYGVQAYWAPFHPIENGHYHPPGQINGCVLHFAAESYGEHILSFVGFAYAVFLDDVPSVFWIIAATFLLTRRGRESLAQSPYMVLLSIGFLLAPLTYGLLQVVVGHRYLNLFLFWTAMLLLHQGASWLAGLSVRARWSAVLLVFTLAVVELFPFHPFYAAFRPIWLRASDDRTPAAGRINPCWLGWGEEMMLAGQVLRERDSAPMTLHCCYFSGAWIQRDRSIRQLLIHSFLRKEDVTYGEHDYFIINRSIVVQGFPLPDLRADFTISYRGFVQAWVYQGRRLADAGYYYDPSRRQFIHDQDGPDAPNPSVR
jgi:hypothetical protein